ncbi:MAG: hypothetical protein H7Y38_14805 [Armatimonadetes bacterium]|nr:hypothetical protein [Armatimonadota bacterium]
MAPPTQTQLQENKTRWDNAPAGKEAASKGISSQATGEAQTRAANPGALK